jgi:hypothetical protein
MKLPLTSNRYVWFWLTHQYRICRQLQSLRAIDLLQVACRR